VIQFLPHLIAVPVVLPLVAAALLLLLGEKRRRVRTLVNIGATLASLVVAVTILWAVDAGGLPGAVAG
jgi:multicomponent K+:H+ antiporter subunit D